MARRNAFPESPPAWLLVTIGLGTIIVGLGRSLRECRQQLVEYEGLRGR